MTDPNAAPTPNQDPAQFTADHFKLTMDLAQSIADQQSPTVVADNVHSALRYVRESAEVDGINPDAGIAAVVGAGLGAVNNDPSKQLWSGEQTGQLLLELAKTQIDDQEQSLFRDMVNGIRQSPGNINALANILGSGMTHAARQEEAGKDMTAFRTLVLTTGLTGSRDLNWRSERASEIGRLVK